MVPIDVLKIKRLRHWNELAGIPEGQVVSTELSQSLPAHIGILVKEKPGDVVIVRRLYDKHDRIWRHQASPGQTYTSVINRNHPDYNRYDLIIKKTSTMLAEKEEARLRGEEN